MSVSPLTAKEREKQHSEVVNHMYRHANNNNQGYEYFLDDLNRFITEWVTLAEEWRTDIKGDHMKIDVESGLVTKVNGNGWQSVFGTFVFEISNKYDEEELDLFSHGLSN